MSIKIYDGLMAVDSDPFTAGLRIRGVLEDKFLKSYKDFYKQAKEAGPEVSWNDLFYCNDDSMISESIIDRKLHQIIMKLHRKSTHTFSPLDIAYDVTLMKNSNLGGNPLVLVFGEESRAYTELLVDKGVVVEYGYWDNVDEPEELTKSQWNERKKAWRALFDSAPSEIGLTISSPSSMQSTLHLFA